MILNKRSLRITCRKVRSQIVNKEEQSRSIISKLATLPALTSAGSILAYYPLEQEVDILPLIEDLKRSNKKIYLPYFKELKIGLFNNSLIFVDKFDSYQPSQAADDPPLEVIIIPALAFDKAGFRLGQGGGWYDRFLKLYPDSIKIGVCFEEQLLKDIPHDWHDQRVDLVVTPQQLINCH